MIACGVFGGVEDGYEIVFDTVTCPPGVSVCEPITKAEAEFAVTVEEPTTMT